jgi:hypothetical protein
MKRCYAILLTVFLVGLVFLPLYVRSADTEGDAEQSVMFDALLSKRIVDLKVGESVFTAPEALVVDEARKCWIHPYYITTEEDTKFKVTKLKNGYGVEIKDSKMRWSRVNLEGDDPAEKKLRKLLVPVRAIKAAK